LNLSFSTYLLSNSVLRKLNLLESTCGYFGGSIHEVNSSCISASLFCPCHGSVQFLREKGQEFYKTAYSAGTMTGFDAESNSLFCNPVACAKIGHDMHDKPYTSNESPIQRTRFLTAKPCSKTTIIICCDVKYKSPYNIKMYTISK